MMLHALVSYSFIKLFSSILVIWYMSVHLRPSSSTYPFTVLNHLPVFLSMVCNIISFIFVKLLFMTLLTYWSVVSMTLDFTIEDPISPLRAATVEYPPIPIRYLHILFSFLCSAPTIVLDVGTTALPDNMDGMATNFHMALPTTTLSALFCTSAITVLTFLSAFSSNSSFSFLKMSLPLPPTLMPR